MSGLETVVEKLVEFAARMPSDKSGGIIRLRELFALGILDKPRDIMSIYPVCMVAARDANAVALSGQPAVGITFDFGITDADDVFRFCRV